MDVEADIRSKVTIFYKDVRAAADAGKTMDDELVKMKKDLAKMRMNPDVPRDVIKYMESVQHKLNGDRIEISQVVDPAVLVKAFKESK
jgi:hypothetical protein